jgi:hypothetical protein
MRVKKFVLVTTIEDSNIGKTYLKDKFYHLSYITSDLNEAKQFNTKKEAKNYLNSFKMDLNLWNIEKI